MPIAAPLLNPLWVVAVNAALGAEIEAEAEADADTIGEVVDPPLVVVVSIEPSQHGLHMVFTHIQSLSQSSFVAQTAPKQCPGHVHAWYDVVGVDAVEVLWRLVFARVVVDIRQTTTDPKMPTQLCVTRQSSEAL